jgi:drug/metabolite transporter (DMT)-like permease
MGGKIIFMKRTLESIQAIKLTFWDLLSAVCVFSTLALLFDRSSPIELGTPVILAMFYQGVIVSVVGFLLWLSLLKRHSPNVLNVFRLFTPPFGVILGAWILSERVASTVGLSMLLISIGLYLVQQSAHGQRHSTGGRTS